MPATDVDTTHPANTLGWRQESGEQAEKGRLAGTVRTEDDKAISRAEREAHAVDGASSAERADETFGFSTAAGGTGAFGMLCRNARWIRIA